MAHGEIDGNEARLGPALFDTSSPRCWRPREAINKQLAAWSHKGIVSTEDGGLTVLDLANFGRMPRSTGSTRCEARHSGTGAVALDH